MFDNKDNCGQSGPPIIDFHSHILPGMDDGSKSVEMSLQMLDLCGEMGIHTILATSHFYGFREGVSDFLARRDHAWRKLSAALRPEHPKVLLGAEVTLFSRLTAMDGLDSLCIGDTNTLLLEMPFSPWSGLELDMVSNLCLNRGYRVVLAHFERFLPYQKDQHIVGSLLALPLWVQVNAGQLCSFSRRKPALELFRSGKAHLLGSDCHNLDRRPPNLESGRAVLRKKLGQRILDEIDACGRWLLDPESNEDEI